MKTLVGSLPLLESSLPDPSKLTASKAKSIYAGAVKDLPRYEELLKTEKHILKEYGYERTTNGVATFTQAIKDLKEIIEKYKPYA